MNSAQEEVFDDLDSWRNVSNKQMTRLHICIHSVVNDTFHNIRSLCILQAMQSPIPQLATKKQQPSSEVRSTDKYESPASFLVSGIPVSDSRSYDTCSA